MKTTLHVLLTVLLAAAAHAGPFSPTVSAAIGCGVAATNRLADYKRPKSFIPLVGSWPASAQGKVNRAGLAERVAAQLKQRR